MDLKAGAWTFWNPALMRFVLLRKLALLTILLGLVNSASGQFIDAVIDPARGPRPIVGPGGYVTGGFGFSAYGPGGYGFYPGLYIPPNDLGNGPSPYYSPVFNAMAGIPPIDQPYRGPGGERAGWAFRPSLPFTGKSVIHRFIRR